MLAVNIERSGIDNMFNAKFLTLNGEWKVNKVLSILVLTFLSSGAIASDLMKRFDLDSNDLVTMVELEQAGCTIKIVCSRLPIEIKTAL